MLLHRSTLGRRLKDLRKKRGLSGKEVADLVCTSQSLISRLERGIIKPSQTFLRDFTDKLHLTADERADLQELAEFFAFTFRRWSQADADFASLQEHVRRHESRAQLIQSFELAVIVGLLQTEEYIEGLFKIGTDAPSREITKAVKKRMQRQSDFFSSSKTLRAVLSEQVLYTRIVDAAGMARQMDRLLELIRHPRVDLRILERETVLPVLPVNSFTIFDDTLTWVETLGMNVFSREPETLNQYSKTFTALYTVAASGETAESLIKKARAQAAM